MRLHRTKAGLISKDPVWVWGRNGYLYIHETLPGLLWQIISEWEDDKHLVG